MKNNTPHRKDGIDLLDESKFHRLLMECIDKEDLRGQEAGLYIFGAGQGGQALLTYLSENHTEQVRYVIKGFFDNNSSKHGTTLKGVPITAPNKEAVSKGNFVVIASYDYCYEMNEQLFDLGVDEGKIIFPDDWLGSFLLTTKEDNVTKEHRELSTLAQVKASYQRIANLCTYVENTFINASGKFKEFVEYDERKQVKLGDDDTKLIAFYLPQFHPILENDQWWGRGFTEWTNVTKAVPQYLGHNQPHLPIDVGFYDLRNIDVMKRQTELARQYGIYGFCFYHYWFGGKRLLEKPVNNLLENPDIQYPFCLCWANENWTRRWDGLNHEILISQNHSPEDDIAFIEDVARYFNDSRYIRINGKPLFIVYRPMLFPDPKATIKRWRDYCCQQGIGELFIVGVKAFGLRSPQTLGLDAVVEFPPNSLYAPQITNQVSMMNPDFSGQIYDYKDCVRRKQYLKRDSYITFKTAMPGWDNTARRPNNPTIFHGAEPIVYQEWLEDIMRFTKRHLAKDSQFIFINAWNEWAEGAHLEPDRKYGYGNLQATANALLNTRTI
ncbi:glycoside hydrolase family 99-like domain-containing protein [Anaerospora hongkongensis]|uniref:glycoside hydrolase family 99-like domain-containing protein n=1 Tax=Anaerospora hongkongensis TaxID=244830 RepID=UPI00289DA25D|nr:glycoside hydrolase family 99-like domain-containing protein [Anaerospora hongkongensis]